VGEEAEMTVLIVYGDPQGAARAPAVRLARALRALGVSARVHAAGRVARLGRPAAVVLAVDRAGRGEIEELIESFGLPGDAPALFGLRGDDAPLPPGVPPLSGTRSGGAAPHDAGAPLRLASALTAGLRRRGDAAAS
jgi:hypothetical protein